jgi:hypothetical protein
VFSQIGPGTIYNQNTLTFKFAQQLHPARDAAQGMD